MKIPVFPINLGEFGFIAAVQPDEWETSLEEFLQNNSPFVERTMMKLCVQKKNEVVELYGLNDVVISAKETARTISLCVEYNNNPLCFLATINICITYNGRVYWVFDNEAHFA